MRIVGFIVAIAGGILLAKTLGSMRAQHLVAEAQSKRQQQEVQLSPARKPSLQDIVHDEVLEGRKGLPRMKADAIRLIGVDEAQNQMIYTYEFVGISPEAITPPILYEMREEITANFRGTACRNDDVARLLRQGMSIAQIYRLADSKQKVLTMVLSIRDC